MMAVITTCRLLLFSAAGAAVCGRRPAAPQVPHAAAEHGGGAQGPPVSAGSGRRCGIGSRRGTVSQQRSCTLLWLSPAVLLPMPPHTPGMG